MTLPAALPLSMSQVAAELSRTLPLSLSDPMIIALAGKPGLPVSFSDLLGQTGGFSKNGTVVQAGSFEYYVNLPVVNFFRGNSQFKLDESTSSANLLVTNFGQPINWTGKLSVTSHLGGSIFQQLTLSYIGGQQWGGAGGGGAGGIGIYGSSGVTMAFIIYPSN